MLLIPQNVKRSHIATNWLKMAKGISWRCKRNCKSWNATNKLCIIQIVGNAVQNNVNAVYTPLKNVQPGPKVLNIIKKALKEVGVTIELYDDFSGSIQNILHLK